MFRNLASNFCNFYWTSQLRRIPRSSDNFSYISHYLNCHFFCCVKSTFKLVYFVSHDCLCDPNFFNRTILFNFQYKTGSIFSSSTYSLFAALILRNWLNLWDIANNYSQPSIKICKMTSNFLTVF